MWPIEDPWDTLARYAVMLNPAQSPRSPYQTRSYKRRDTKPKSKGKSTKRAANYRAKVARRRNRAA